MHLRFLNLNQNRPQKFVATSNQRPPTTRCVCTGSGVPAQTKYEANPISKTTSQDFKRIHKSLSNSAGVECSRPLIYHAPSTRVCMTVRRSRITNERLGVTAGRVFVLGESERNLVASAMTKKSVCGRLWTKERTGRYKWKRATM